MTDEAKVSMILCSGLEPAEQAKVERLDAPISEKFVRAGLVARICRASGTGDQRVHNFCEPPRTVGTVRAADFLAATDVAAVAMITLAGS